RGPDECWPWTASDDGRGYGAFGIRRRVEKAHRVAFFLDRGRWPEQFCCHSCDNPSCVNPAHLFEGTHDDNMRDMAAKWRAASKRRSNLYNQPSGNDHWSRRRPELLPRRLTDEQVREIRSLRGRETQTATARRFGVRQTHVSNIQLGKSYADVR